MEESEFEEIWQLMDKYTFQTTCEVPSDLKCVLCKSLIKNARISHCGCRFCKACIEEFLANGNTICPGNSIACSDESLYLTKNIWNDNPSNRRILKISVMCPTQTCLHTNILKDMKKHLDTCKGSFVKCPFSHLGCNESNLNVEDINNHLNSQKDNHINIMIRKVEDLVTENEALKAENKLINDKIIFQEMQITQMDAELENSRKSILTKLDKLIQAKEEKLLGESKPKAEMEELIKDLKWKLHAYVFRNSKEFVWKFKWSEIKNQGFSKSSENYTHPAGFKMKICLKRNQTHFTGYYNETTNENNYQLYLQITSPKNKVKPLDLNVTIGIVDEGINEFIKGYNETFELNHSPQNLKPYFQFQDSDLPEYTRTSDIMIIKCLVQVQD